MSFKRITYKPRSYTNGKKKNQRSSYGVAKIPRPIRADEYRACLEATIEITVRKEPDPSTVRYTWFTLWSSGMQTIPSANNGSLQFVPEFVRLAGVFANYRVTGMSMDIASVGSVSQTKFISGGLMAAGLGTGFPLTYPTDTQMTTMQFNSMITSENRSRIYLNCAKYDTENLWPALRTGIDATTPDPTCKVICVRLN